MKHPVWAKCRVS